CVRCPAGNRMANEVLSTLHKLIVKRAAQDFKFGENTVYLYMC
ncbi:hypothetical protein BN1184_AY_00010, partial [Pantoea ananatis]